MRSKKEIIVGSRAFFEDFGDFSPKDKDLLCIMTDICIPDFVSWQFKDDNNIDVIMIKDMTKEELMNHSLDEKDPILVGKLLVPEVINYFNITIDDLKKAKPIIDLLDDKHKYYQDIYNAYLENNALALSPKQLENAYKTYKYFRN